MAGARPAGVRGFCSGPSGGTYDQAQQPLLILAGGLHAARNGDQ